MPPRVTANTAANLNSTKMMKLSNIERNGNGNVNANGNSNANTNTNAKANGRRQRKCMQSKLW